MPLKVCFLGYNRHQTRIVEAIEKQGCVVEEYSREVNDFSSYDFVISFGYPHIIGQVSLQTLTRPAINLHIGYLPYNRGAHPNFWSWIEGTPAGVTIHEINPGIDTGPICFQKKVDFGEDSGTFNTSYTRLIRELETLFIDNIEVLLSGTYSPRPQSGTGSYHNTKDLPEWMNSWDLLIDDSKRLNMDD